MIVSTNIDKMPNRSKNVELKTIKNNLIQHEKNLLKPSIRKSKEKLLELLDEKFIEFSSSGRIFNREETIQSLLKELKIKISAHDFKLIKLAPKTFLLTYRTARKGCDNFSKIYSLRSSIWKLIGTQWRMVFHQGTIISNG